MDPVDPVDLSELDEATRAKVERKLALQAIPAIDETEVATLTAAGATRARAIRALIAAHSDPTVPAVDFAKMWLESTADDPTTFEDPPESSYRMKKPLTPEETLALIAKRRAEREAQAAADAKAQELKRMEDGKKAQEIKEAREAMLRRTALDERKREQEADAKARAKVLAQIDADRAARGLPPLHGAGAAPPAPAAAAAAAAAGGGGDARGVLDSQTEIYAARAKRLAAAVELLKSRPPPSAPPGYAGERAWALAVLLKVVANLAQHPENPKYRAVGAPAVKRLSAVAGAVDALEAVGFAPPGPEGGMALSVYNAQVLQNAEHEFSQITP